MVITFGGQFEEVKREIELLAKKGIYLSNISLGFSYLSVSYNKRKGAKQRNTEWLLAFNSPELDKSELKEKLENLEDFEKSLLKKHKHGAHSELKRKAAELYRTSYKGFLLSILRELEKKEVPEKELLDLFSIVEDILFFLTDIIEREKN